MSDDRRNHRHENAPSHARATNGAQRAPASAYCGDVPPCPRRFLREWCGYANGGQRYRHTIHVSRVLRQRRAQKSYVPKLRKTYNASELKDDHPVRFTNRGWKLDHSEDRTHEFCWRVPQAGRGNAFWIPLRINPAQRELWTDLFNDDVTVGEFRLQEHRKNWVLARHCRVRGRGARRTGRPNSGWLRHR